jgi:hypothetical protein
MAKTDQQAFAITCSGQRGCIVTNMLRQATGNSPIPDRKASYIRREIGHMKDRERPKCWERAV